MTKLSLFLFHIYNNIQLYSLLTNFSNPLKINKASDPDTRDYICPPPAETTSPYRVAIDCPEREKSCN